MAPEPTGIGKAVQQDDRPALPGDLILRRDPVDVYPAHLASLRAAGLTSAPAVAARDAPRAGLSCSAPVTLPLAPVRAVRCPSVRDLPEGFAAGLATAVVAMISATVAMHPPAVEGDFSRRSGSMEREA